MVAKSTTYCVLRIIVILRNTQYEIRTTSYVLRVLSACWGILTPVFARVHTPQLIASTVSPSPCSTRVGDLDQNRGRG